MEKKRRFRKFKCFYMIAIIIAVAGMAIAGCGTGPASTETIDFDNIPENVILMSPNGVAPSTGMSQIGQEPIVVHHEATGHYESRLVADAWDEQVQTGTKTVVDKAAWDETVTHYVCTECGATKQK